VIEPYGDRQAPNWGDHHDHDGRWQATFECGCCGEVVLLGTDLWRYNHRKGRDGAYHLCLAHWDKMFSRRRMTL
jgi:hypothetical protein